MRDPGFVRSHVRLVGSSVLGVVVGACVAWRWPKLGVLGAALVGWNAAVWVYLVAVLLMMWRADRDHLQQRAARYGERSGNVAVIVAGAALASLAGLFGELIGNAGQPQQGWLPSVLAWSTLIGSWLLVPMVFAQAYAHYWWRPARAPAAAGMAGGRAARTVGRGLEFPMGAHGDAASFAPGYVDFAYLSFTISTSTATSDVNVTDSAMRHLVLVHTLVAFAFNAAILGLTLNVTASLFAPQPNGASPAPAAAPASP